MTLLQQAIEKNSQLLIQMGQMQLATLQLEMERDALKEELAKFKTLDEVEK